MFYVYVLMMSNGELYAGFTVDLKRRMIEHRSGRNHTTRRYLPTHLIFYEAYISEIDARRREKYFKTSKGKTTLRIMLTDTLK